jgi:hypothetical protein
LLKSKRRLLYRGETESYDNQLSGILKKKNRKRTNIYIHTHTSMHVGMHDCMRSESESELDNQLSGILRKSNKQICILLCLRMYVRMRSESDVCLSAGAHRDTKTHTHTSNTKNTGKYTSSSDRKSFICTGRGGTHSHTHTSIHIQVLMQIHVK